MNPGRRCVTALVAALFALAACSDASGTSDAAVPATTTTTSTTSTTAPPAPVDADRVYAVGARSEIVVDPTRITRASGGAPERPERTIPLLLLYPTEGEPGGGTVEDAAPAEGRFPVLVYAHGFTATGPAYAEVGRLLAEQGYVVALPTFPLSSGGRATPPDVSDYVEQPADVSFVLGEALRLLPDSTDAEHVAAVGHSLGGMTTLGIAYDECCADDRFDAYVAIAGRELPFPGDGGFDYADRRSPLLLIHGDADQTVPYDGSVSVFEQATGPRAFVSLLGGPHTPVLPPYGSVVLASMVDFLDAEIGGQPDGIERLQTDADVPGVATVEVTGGL